MSFAAYRRESISGALDPGFDDMQPAIVFISRLAALRDDVPDPSLRRVERRAGRPDLADVLSVQRVVPLHDLGGPGKFDPAAVVQRRARIRRN